MKNAPTTLEDALRRLESVGNTSADRRDTLVRLRHLLQLANERAKRRKVALIAAGIPVPEDPHDPNH